jgi:hypothetical protein
MIEASLILGQYLKNKFRTNPNCLVFNEILSDMNDDAYFYDLDPESYVDTDHMNFGLSKISGGGDILRKQKNAGEFLSLNVKHNLDLIKIDTENRDYNIIFSMTDYVKNLNTKPFICFENNYHNDMSSDKAQSILDEFTSKCAYENIKVLDISWSSVFLIPQN